MSSFLRTMHFFHMVEDLQCYERAGLVSMVGRRLISQLTPREALPTGCGARRCPGARFTISEIRTCHVAFSLNFSHHPSMLVRASLETRIREALRRSRGVVLAGPRQVGKTTLARGV